MAYEPHKDNKVLAAFHHLRNEQRSLINNLNTLEMDLKEHNTVIETLGTADPDRKCFRLIGGVLCERTVKDVLPQLEENKQFIVKTIQAVNEDLTKKGLQINKFKEENKIRLRGEPIPNEEDKSDEGKTGDSRSGVLL